MARTIRIANSQSAEEITAVPGEISNGDSYWTHLVTSEDKAFDIVLQEIGEDEEFEEDLLEDQRPRITNLKNFSVIVVNLPVRKIVEGADKDDGTLQVSFIISPARLISISQRSSPLIDKYMDTLLKKKHRSLNPAIILSDLLETFVENAIDSIELLDHKTDQLQKQIISGKGFAKILTEVEEIKENLFLAGKQLRADLEVVREILFVQNDHIDAKHFSGHIQERILHAIDIVDTAREALQGINNLYLTALSNDMNVRIYKLTNLGAFLLVPATIAAIWGMNVPLPVENFWFVLGISTVFSALIWLWLNYRA